MSEITEEVESAELLAVYVLSEMLSLQPEQKLVNDVTVCDVACLAAALIKSCPKCGGDPHKTAEGDCDVCQVICDLTDP
jgi:hypothetical protein